MNLSRKALSRDGELRTFKTTENTEAAFAGTEGVLGMRVFECSNAKKPRSTRLADLSSFRHDRSNAFWCHPIDNVENFKSAKLRSLESCVGRGGWGGFSQPRNTRKALIRFSNTQRDRFEVFAVGCSWPLRGQSKVVGENCSNRSHVWRGVFVV